jgi:hypothetical protein
MNKKFWKRRNKNSLQADVDAESTAENSEIRNPLTILGTDSNSSPVVLQRQSVEDNKEDEMVPQTTNDVAAIDDNTATNPAEKTLHAALNHDMFVAQRTVAKYYKSFTRSVYAVAACADKVLTFSTDKLCAEDDMSTYASTSNELVNV